MDLMSNVKFNEEGQIQSKNIFRKIHNRKKWVCSNQAKWGLSLIIKLRGMNFSTPEITFPGYVSLDDFWFMHD